MVTGYLGNGHCVLLPFRVVLDISQHFDEEVNVEAQVGVELEDFANLVESATVNDRLVFLRRNLNASWIVVDDLIHTFLQLPTTVDFTNGLHLGHYFFAQLFINFQSLKQNGCHQQNHLEPKTQADMSHVTHRLWLRWRSIGILLAAILGF